RAGGCEFLLGRRRLVFAVSAASGGVCSGGVHAFGGRPRSERAAARAVGALAAASDRWRARRGAYLRRAPRLVVHCPGGSAASGYGGGVAAAGNAVVAPQFPAGTVQVEERA